ncbi:MAG: serine protease [Pedosphaera sp.]|nr:serine protease [Pedosphaera sp.]
MVNPTPHRSLMKLIPILALVLLTGPVQFMRAEDPAAPMARKLFAAQQDSVVWVSAVIKISISAEGGKEGVNIPDREQKVEALATFIDDKGMLVTALSSIDPTKQISGQEIRTASGTTKIEASATMKEVKIIMPDSTEVPGEVVLRDADLDLAFIRPKAGSKEAEGLTYKPIDLKSAGTSIPTDEVIVIARQNEILSRVPTVIIGQVMAVTKKPRAFLIVNGAVAGCPTYAESGKVLGIAAQRFVKGKGTALVIVPAADVLEIAEQAKTAKPEKTEKPAVKKEVKEN